MDDDKATTTDAEGTVAATGLTVIVLPDDRAGAVLDYLASLQHRDEEVAGHMLAGGMIGGIGGALGFTQKISTGCKYYNSGPRLGWDTGGCTDTKTITTR